MCAQVLIRRFEAIQEVFEVRVSGAGGLAPEILSRILPYRFEHSVADRATGAIDFEQACRDEGVERIDRIDALGFEHRLCAFEVKPVGEDAECPKTRSDVDVKQIDRPGNRRRHRAMALVEAAGRRRGRCQQLLDAPFNISRR